MATNVCLNRIRSARRNRSDAAGDILEEIAAVEDHAESVLAGHFLEQYLLGEASSEVVQLIESDREALDRIARLQEENQEILQTYPPGWFADRVMEKTEGKTEGKRKGRSRRVLSLRNPLLVPVAALAVLGALLIPRLLTDGGTSEELARGERLKGIESELFLYRSGEDGTVETLSDGSTARDGDRLQITCRAVGATQGVILSVDGRRLVTLHYPESPYESTELVSDGEVVLPYACVLDDAPAFEQFYLITFPESVDVIDLVSRIAAEAGERHREDGEISLALTIFLGILSFVPGPTTAVTTG